jgi:hypothetical protein
MTNYKDDGCKDYYPHPRRRPRPKINQTILACGNGSGLIIPQHDQNDSQLFNPYVIASVAIDTSDLKKANVKVDFSSIITFREDDTDDLRLTFQLSKSYQFGNKIPLGTWTFERDFESDEDVDLTDSFAFHFCECDACPGCAYYIVELINVESNGVNFVAITSPMISALAVGPLDDDDHDDYY